MNLCMRNVALVFALVWTISSEAIAAEKTCSLDAEFYAAQANKLARAHPGARLDGATGTVSWSSPQHGQVEVQVGGCEHLSLRVRSTRGLGNKSERAARKHAAALVQFYWPKPFAKQVAAALRSTRPTTTTMADGQVVLEFAVAGYDEVVLIYWAHGASTEVEVSAIVPS